MFGFGNIKRKKDPFNEDGYILLGSDGLDHIATVQTTPEEAQAVVDLLNSQPADAWEQFVKKTNNDNN